MTWRTGADDFISLVPILVLLLILTAGGPLTAEDIDPRGPPCTIQNPLLFEHVEIPDPFKPIVMRLLESSPTFRRQCERLVTSTGLTLIVRMTMSGLTFPVRSTVQRLRTGAFTAWIDLMPRSRLRPEDIAHEFEHVIERLDGVDVRDLARRGAGAYEVRPGLFETERALRAGRRVAREDFTSRKTRGAAVRATR